MPTDFCYIRTFDELVLAYEAIMTRAYEPLLIALDAETYQAVSIAQPYSFTDPYTHKVKLIQLRLPDGIPYLIDVQFLQDLSEARELIIELLTIPNATYLGWNLKFDLKMIYGTLGVWLPKVYDLMTAAYLIGYATGISAYRSRGMGLKDALRDYLGIRMDKTEQVSVWSGELTSEQLTYAAGDVLHLHDLHALLHTALVEDYQCPQTLQLEQDILPFIAEIEYHGIGFDLELYEFIQTCAKRQLPKLAEKLGLYFKVPMQQDMDPVTLAYINVPLINWASQPQVLSLFRSHGIELDDLEFETVSAAAKSHEILQTFLDYKAIDKQISTPLGKWVHPLTGRIHGEIDQNGAATGRFTAQDPNLQQVPRVDIEIPTDLVDPDKHARFFDKDRNVYLVNYRYCFIPKPGNILYASDYSAQELGIMAVASMDQNMIDVLNREEKIKVVKDGVEVEVSNPEADLHSINCERAFGIPKEKSREPHPTIPGKSWRDLAKAVSFGACIAAGERVATDRGLLPIEEVQVGDHVMTDTGRQPVTAVMDNGAKPVMTLQLQGGYQLTCTPDHRIRVIDPSGAYLWKAARDITDEDYVALKSGTWAEGSEKLWHQPAGPYEVVTSYKHLPMPTEWTPELARFLGYFVSEGSMEQASYGVVYSQVLGPICDDMLYVAKKLWGDRVKTAEVIPTEGQPQKRISIHSKDLSLWLQGQGLNVLNPDKLIPESVFRAPVWAQIEFIRALFAGDGSLKAGAAITYASKSERLVRETQRLLLNLGVVTSIAPETRRNYPGQVYWALNVIDVYNAIEVFGDFKLTGKEVTHDRQIGNEAIPYQLDCLRQVYPHLRGRIEKYDPRPGRQSKRLVKEKIYECLRHNSPVRLNEERLGLIVKETHLAGMPAYEHLKRLYGMRLTYRKVIKTSAGQARVYDLSVANEHCFTANGVVVHNCYGQSPQGFANTWNIAKEEAEKIVKSILSAMPTLNKWLSRTGKEGDQTRLSRFGLDRLRFLNDSRHGDRGAIKRAAYNTPIQGVGSQMIKHAILFLGTETRRLRQEGIEAFMLYPVHDELLAEAPAEHAEFFREVIKTQMNASSHIFLKGIVPDRASCSYGDHWQK